MKSRNRGEDAYLADARDRGLEQMLSDIPVIAEASKEPAKYVHLLSARRRWGWLLFPADLGDYAFPEVRRGLRKRIRYVRVLANEAKVEVVYVQPEESMDDRVISFRAVAEYLDTLDDPFAETFASTCGVGLSLRERGRRKVRPSRRIGLRGTDGAEREQDEAEYAVFIEERLRRLNERNEEADD